MLPPDINNIIGLLACSAAVNLTDTYAEDDAVLDRIARGWIARYSPSCFCGTVSGIERQEQQPDLSINNNPITDHLLPTLINLSIHLQRYAITDTVWLDS
jgi:hypothetical protein